MDDDDDFFDMRGRFRIPEKRKRQKKRSDDEDSGSSSGALG
jgi:hypothetical protein